MIVYNVPSRTGVDIKPDTYVKLAEHDKIVGIKEANGNISSVVETMAKCGDKIDMYSGNDDQIVPIMSMGGIGCISVLSNILPAETKKITDLFFAGDIAGAAALQCRYKALIDALFCETNPIPAKAACAAMGLCTDYARLPMTKMEDANREKMLKLMRAEGINV
jgi:4-hydroxy-tetrahydrodipicolinate synthase